MSTEKSAELKMQCLQLAKAHGYGEKETLEIANKYFQWIMQL